METKRRRKTWRTNNNKIKQARKHREKQKQKKEMKQRIHNKKTNTTQKETIYRHATKHIIQEKSIKQERTRTRK